MIICPHFSGGIMIYLNRTLLVIHWLMFVMAIAGLLYLTLLLVLWAWLGYPAYEEHFVTAIAMTPQTLVLTAVRFVVEGKTRFFPWQQA